LRRAAELRVGGILVVDVLASVADADDPSGVRAAGRRLYRAFWQIACGLAEEGRIDRDLLERFVFPVYFRLSDETRAARTGGRPEGRPRDCRCRERVAPDAVRG
jgi:hypothetical protein